MFVQSQKFIEAHAGRIGDISIYGQESNYTTWRLAKMNLAIRGIDAQVAHGDTFHNDRHPDLKADYRVFYRHDGPRLLIPICYLAFSPRKGNLAPLTGGRASDAIMGSA